MMERICPGQTAISTEFSQLRSTATGSYSNFGLADRLDYLVVPLVTACAPGLLSLYGLGPNTAALLLIAAGDRPERRRSQAAWA